MLNALSSLASFATMTSGLDSFHDQKTFEREHLRWLKFRDGSYNNGNCVRSWLEEDPREAAGSPARVRRIHLL